MAYFCTRNDEIVHDIAVCGPGAAVAGSGAESDGGGGAGRDGFADVRADGEGGKGATRRRQHTVYGDEQRIRVSPADL